MNPHSDADCPMAHAVGILGDRWTLLIVREALRGARRYEDFKSSLQMSDHTLTRKLRTLIDDGLLERDSQQPRAVYRLTAAGEDLADVLAILGMWTQQWFPLKDPAPPPQPVADAIQRLSSQRGAIAAKPPGPGYLATERRSGEWVEYQCDTYGFDRLGSGLELVHPSDTVCEAMLMPANKLCALYDQINAEGGFVTHGSRLLVEANKPQ